MIQNSTSNVFYKFTNISVYSCKESEWNIMKLLYVKESFQKGDPTVNIHSKYWYSRKYLGSVHPHFVLSFTKYKTK